MALDGQITTRVLAALELAPGQTRLVEDADLLRRSIAMLMNAGVVRAPIDTDALELATLALQLPVRHSSARAGSLGILPLRERVEQSAQMLVDVLAGHADEDLLDRTIRVLHETPQRTPVLDESKLLSDAINLADFGVVGVVQLAVHHAQAGRGLMQLLDAIEKRETYRYWEARVREGFHFEPARRAAWERLESARQLAQQLKREVDPRPAGRGEGEAS